MKLNNSNFQILELTRIVALTVVLFSSAMTMAAELPVRGTIQVLQQDGGIIRISGRDLNFQDESVTITVDGREIGAEFLSEGMVVRYTLNAQGYLETIEILGPKNLVGTLSNS
ncbi:MAG: hypothetical protein R3F50_01420 [Gammaproteobacteria bacterium]|jgi:hypothetical protein